MIKDRLLSLPSEIEKLKIDIIYKQWELQTIREQLKSWEIVELSHISNETDDKGKAIYSNETKRQAELQFRKDSSEEYGAMESKSKKLDEEIALLNVKLDKLYNEQGNLRAICRLEGVE